jgi:hypothetical protein
MPKIQLKPKAKPKLTLRPLVKSILKPQKTQYYDSGYAFTDNATFCLFGIDQKILLDNFIQDGVLGFHFTEEMVDMRIDRQTQINPMPVDNDMVSIGPLGSVKKPVIDLIRKIAPMAIVHPVTEWFGEPVNALACCLENGKLVAVVKTI